MDQNTRRVGTVSRGICETENGKLFRVYDEQDNFFAVMQIHENQFLKLKTTFFRNGESAQ